jgi:ribulose kinase
MSNDPATPLVVGVDFETLSDRAVVVQVADRAELGSAVGHLLGRSIWLWTSLE